MAVIYIIAFWSIYIQYSGLLGQAGLLPMDAFHQSQQAPLEAQLRAARGEPTPFRLFLQRPTLAWWAPSLHWDLDVLHEGVLLTGGCLGALALGGICHASVYLGMWLLYLTAFLGGQRWLSFQWDILLLEAGALTVLYAPWGSCSALTLSSPPTRWLLRWLLFKLMFQSGVVKVLSNCPTWLGLTALEFHYATQCLPTALAWYAHQLPPIIQRLSVAVTLWAEVAAPVLLLCPFTGVRRLGAAVQIVLQVAILLTGNYNFFNLLTLALCLPAMEGDHRQEDRADEPGEPCQLKEVLCSRSFERLGPSLWLASVGVSAQRNRPLRLTLNYLALLYLAWAWRYLIAYEKVTEAPGAGVSTVWGESVRLGLRLDAKSCEDLVVRVLPPLVGFMAAGLLLSCLNQIFTSTRGGRADMGAGRPRTIAGVLRAAWGAVWALLYCAAALALFVNSSVMFVTLSPQLYRFLPASAVWLYQTLAPWHMSSAYGLFRRMTGVGEPPEGSAAGQWGVGGRPPSVVARPEIILEGSMDGKKWKEVHFKYKPGDANDRPKQVAPHQPRLDWQMWFAALDTGEGRFSANPWLLHLAHKLMLGCPEALLLLDQPKYPFKKKPPRAIRAVLYKYDFTRWNTSWAHRVPGVKVIPHNSTQWWHRQPEHSEWMPALERGNPSLEQFLRHHGLWSDGCHTAPSSSETCRDAQAHHSLLGTACRVILSVRHKGGWWGCLGMSYAAALALTWAARRLRQRTRQTHSAGKMGGEVRVKSKPD